jgi:D-glycero-D-manno-heptose 1,7-bisphosphate phosphatase
MLTKAVFMDRDGTILKEIAGENDDDLGYLIDENDVELIDGSADAISLIKRSGYKTIIITNQSAIARGWLSEEALQRINQKMERMLVEKDPEAVIDDIFFCAYHVNGIIEKYRKEDPCRKPDIGMILKAKEKYNIDLHKSYMIGDSYSDIKCGDNAGTKKILVLTGYGNIAYRKCLDERIKIDFIAENLLEAVKYIEQNDL